MVDEFARLRDVVVNCPPQQVGLPGLTERPNLLNNCGVQDTFLFLFLARPGACYRVESVASGSQRASTVRSCSEVYGFDK